MDQCPTLSTRYEMALMDPTLERGGEESGGLSRITEVFGTARCSGEEKSVVGRIHGYRFNLEEARFDEPDAHPPGDLHWMHAILDTGGCLREDLFEDTGLDAGEIRLEDDVMIVDRIEIVPEIQGQGVGIDFLRDFLQIAGRGAGIAIARAFPLQFERLPGYPIVPSPWGSEWHRRMAFESCATPFEDSLRALIGFYRRCGFCRVGPAGSDETIMLKALS